MPLYGMIERVAASQLDANVVEVFLRDYRAGGGASPLYTISVGITDAKGSMLVEWGDTCDGWTLDQRYRLTVTALSDRFGAATFNWDGGSMRVVAGGVGSLWFLNRQPGVRGERLRGAAPELSRQHGLRSGLS